MKDDTTFVYYGETYEELKDKPMFLVKTLVIGENGFTEVGFRSLELLENVDTVIIKDSNFWEYYRLFSEKFSSQIKCLDLSLCKELKIINDKLMFYKFGFMKNLERIILPEGLEEIGNYAFRSFENLKRINIPKSIKKCGNWIFGYYSNFEIDELFINDFFPSNSMESFNNISLKKVIIEKRDGDYRSVVKKFLNSTIEELIIYDKIPEIYYFMREFVIRRYEGSKLTVKKIVYKNAEDFVNIRFESDFPNMELRYCDEIDYPRIINYDISELEELTFPSNVKELVIPGFSVYNFNINVFGTTITSDMVKNLLYSQKSSRWEHHMQDQHIFIKYDNFKELIQTTRKIENELGETGKYNYVFFVGPTLSSFEMIYIRSILGGKTNALSFIENNIVNKISDIKENVKEDKTEYKDEEIDSLLNQIKGIASLLPDNYKTLIKDAVNKYYNEYLNDFDNENELSISNKKIFGSDEIGSSRIRFITKLQSLIFELSSVQDQIEKLSKLCEYKKLISDEDFEPKDEKEKLIKKILEIAKLLPQNLKEQIYNDLRSIIDKKCEEYNTKLDNLFEEEIINLEMPKKEESLLKNLSDYNDLVFSYYSSNKEYITLLNTIDKKEVDIENITNINGIIMTIRKSIELIHNESLKEKMSNTFENILIKHKRVIEEKIKLFNTNNDYKEYVKSVLEEINIFLETLRKVVKEDNEEFTFKEDLEESLSILKEEKIVIDESVGIVSSLVVDIYKVFLSNKDDVEINKKRTAVINYICSVKIKEKALDEKDNLIKYLSNLLIELEMYISRKEKHMKVKKQKDYISKKMEEFKI